MPSAQPRWKSFLTGWSVQALSLLGLGLVSAGVHETYVAPRYSRVTELVTYQPLTIEEPQPIVPHVSVRPKLTPNFESPVPAAKPAVEALLVTPQTKPVPKVKQFDPEPIAPAALKLDPKMPVVPAAPTSQVVAVGTFSHESAVTAPVAKLGTTVQPGSFGTGSGNGLPRGTGVSGSAVVANSGFGTGAINSFTGGESRPRASLHQPGSGTSSPVEITFKPKPNYTDEGRKQRVNGEVRLEVLFQSDGRVHVMRVLQGLGYGLDEQAVKAAEQIKFKPAVREGQPVDSTAMVHIIFELIS